MDGRLAGYAAEQHADLTATDVRAEPANDTDAASAGARFAMLTLLAVDGVLSAVAGAIFLPTYLGRFPFPISALVSGLVNMALVWAAMAWTESLRKAALPLWTWLATVAAMTLGGPADDFIFGGRGVMAFAVLLLIVVGSAPPGWLLWRHRQHNREHGSGEEA